MDHANAARTLLWNITSCDWDDVLLKLFEIPRSYLPQCYPIRHCYGYLKNHSIPIMAVNGDQTAALCAAAEVSQEGVWINMGTGAFILKSTGCQLIRHRKLLSGIADSDAQEKRYVLEGTVNNAGSAIDWLSEHESIPHPYQKLDAALRSITDPPLFMNTISGLGSPWWGKGPAPRFHDLDGNPLTDLPADHRLVAVVESILFLIQANLDCMAETHLPIKGITISGGLAQSDALCQKLADLSGLTVQRPALVEATAQGIAWLAAGKPSGWHKQGKIDCFSSKGQSLVRMSLTNVIRSLFPYYNPTEYSPRSLEEPKLAITGMNHFTVLTTDLDKSKAFYVSLLGLTKVIVPHLNFRAPGFTVGTRRSYISWRDGLYQLQFTASSTILPLAHAIFSP